ncbi:MAG: sigma-54 dependent transcriptional regulator [Gammaproteobacteria bacterium]|jgi:sigma-54 specific flagellar transcriptional regulator A|uniref:sigma-54 dependent transcriptional regulator n=1 Tax=Nevskia sp. TaxID=1929292 RepID=UPI0040367D57|nr:sigma-54 dependent transcriptional regulator [Gammaproteobacteria bacterium]
MAESRVLVIDGDDQNAASLASILQFIDFIPVCVPSAAALKLAERRPQEWLAVIIGQEADGAALSRFVEWLKRDRHHPPLLVSPNRQEALCEQFGLDRSACFALDQPVRYAQLNDLLRRAGLVRMDQEAAATRLIGPTGNSAPIRKVRRMIEQVAGHDTTVLVTGESGTGKEVVARAVHEQSNRRDKPFVAVNCGAIPSELLESELFGHEKGAFTGAITSRKGRFEMADGGTLFLDEIGDMTLPMQVKILRVLQERTYERVGSNRSMRCEVRIIAATHRNLEDNIVKGSFREDLFYRLNVFPIEMPALRERLEDLPLLIDDLIDAMRRNGHGSVRLSPDAVHALRAYHWPGNVRELSNLIERLAVLHPHAVVGVAELPARYRQNIPIPAPLPQPLSVPAVAEEDLQPIVVNGRASSNGSIASSSASPASAGGFTAVSSLPPLAAASTAYFPAGAAQLPPDGVNLKDHIETIELALIKQALVQSSGVVAHAAKLLNTRRTTLVEKLRKYGLQRDDGSDPEAATL